MKIENPTITENIILEKFCENTYNHSSVTSSNLLNIVYKGTKIIRTKKGDIQIKAGEAFFMTKGEYIKSEVLGEESSECSIVFFDHELVRKIITNLPFKLNTKNKTSSQNIFKFEINSSMQNTINTLKNYLENKTKFSNELVFLKLQELIYLILETDSKENFVSFCQNLIYNKADLKSFMEANFENDLSLEEFAKLSGRSLSAFKREFKKIFDDTPMKWIIKKRLEKAKFLIQELNYEVGNAAFIVGFKSQAHFSRLYKEKYGINPSFK